MNETLYSFDDHISPRLLTGYRFSSWESATVISNPNDITTTRACLVRVVRVASVCYELSFKFE